MLQPQAQVSGADGSFRFLALPPGVYAVSFDLAGFQTVKREGIRVVINQTLTVDQQMAVATLQETVTVTGDSPIVDTSTTAMGTNFTKELLTEIPNGRDRANEPDANGYFVRTALVRGNPIDRQYDINWNVGGPLWKQRAWFFTSWRLNDQYKFSLGSDLIERSKLSDKYTLKGTFQLTRNNQAILFLNKLEKLQETRGLGPNTPLSAAQYQSSRNYPWKAEWTSVLGSRAFLGVMFANWYNFFPLRPTLEAGLYDGPWGPGRIETTTSALFDGGANSSYQNQKRYKPQFYASLAYFKDGWKGTDDFKIGFDWKRDRRNQLNDQPFSTFASTRACGSTTPHESPRWSMRSISPMPGR